MLRRPRRLRNNEHIRRLVSDTKVTLDDLVYPLFVVNGNNIKDEIPSLPNIFHFSVDLLVEEVRELIDLGIKYIILFGIPTSKDEYGSEASLKTGVVQNAIRKLKQNFDDSIYIISDICMCQYTDHGHCGILNENNYIDNDVTIEHLANIALSHAEAGTDMVAPSDMMDGRVRHIRNKLDNHHFKDIPIMSYSVKYASNFYGPFRDAAGSKPSFGDRSTYQMDYTNKREALKEVELDIEEGADIVMVKPALSYLDIISKIRNHYNVNIAAYNVSGEYAMLRLAIEKGLLNEEVIFETLTSIKRAGADIIISYFTKDFATHIRKGE